MKITSNVPKHMYTLNRDRVKTNMHYCSEDIYIHLHILERLYTALMQPKMTLILIENKCSDKAWICNFPPYEEIMTDRPTDRRADQI